MNPALLSLLSMIAPGFQPGFDDLQEKAVKAAIQLVSPSVVQIETSGGTEVISGPARPGRPGPSAGGGVRKGTGPTTGVVVAADGYVVSSAFNFANKPASIIVSTQGGKRHVARVVATDQSRMITLLKIDAVGLPVPEVLPLAAMQIGQTTLALGRTLAGTPDASPSVSVGILSATGRVWGRAIQTDAKVSPVNYGGPLIDLNGRVLGILVPASPQADGETAGFEWYDSGIGFAIPLEQILSILPRLKQGKDLRRGLLGITLQPGDQFAIEPVVLSVAPNSAASSAGLRPGDKITAINGKAISSHAHLHLQLGPLYEGDGISLALLRGKDEVKIDKAVLTGSVSTPPPAFLGILPKRDDKEKGVAVRHVFPESAASRAGLKPGDRVLKAGLAADAAKAAPTVPIANRDGLAQLLVNANIGQFISVEVKRADGSTATLKGPLGPYNQTLPEKIEDKASLAKLDKEPEKKPETGILKKQTAAGDRAFWVSIPENYDPRVSHGVLIWLHPAGKGKDRDLEDLFGTWDLIAGETNLIVVAPRCDTELGWTPGEVDLITESFKFVTDAYNVDRRRVVAHGMGMGGQMAFYLAFQHRDMVRGVAAVGAGMAANPKERVNSQPLSFFLAVGDKDPLRESVADTAKKLGEFHFPLHFKEMKDRGHQYFDSQTFDQMAVWIDLLDRL
ncbi:MAG: PDZ domain-containing protein [Gemmataceae bacterium]|nr:PDZ domain-containing protein [Gemmataceae bacterium]